MSCWLRRSISDNGVPLAKSNTLRTPAWPLRQTWTLRAASNRRLARLCCGQSSYIRRLARLVYDAARAKGRHHGISFALALGALAAGTSTVEPFETLVGLDPRLRSAMQLRRPLLRHLSFNERHECCSLLVHAVRSAGFKSF